MVCALREVAELHELMPHEAGKSVGDREVSLPRHDRQLGDESRRLRAGGVDDDLGAQHLVAAVHGVRTDRDRRGRPRAPSAPAARARSSSQCVAFGGYTTPSPGTSSPPARPGRRFGSSDASSRGPSTSLAIAVLGVQAMLRAHRRRARPRRSRSRSCHTGRAPPPAAARAPARARSPWSNAVSASCAGESSMTTRCPMPAAVVPLAGVRRLEHEDAQPVARERVRARRADDAGADDDRVERVPPGVTRVTRRRTRSGRDRADRSAASSPPSRTRCRGRAAPARRARRR